jgi:hypothetical protein
VDGANHFEQPTACGQGNLFLKIRAQQGVLVISLSLLNPVTIDTQVCICVFNVNNRFYSVIVTTEQFKETGR